MEPLFDRIVVKRKDGTKVMDSGIVIPEKLEIVSCEGEVIAVGNGHSLKDGRVLAPLCVKVGDTVLFEKRAGTDITIDGVPHLLLREKEVLGIIEG